MNDVDLEITIRSPERLLEFLADAKKHKFLKDVSLDEMKQAISRIEFPVRIPVGINLDMVLKKAENPIIRKLFGDKIENTVKTYLNALETK